VIYLFGSELSDWLAEERRRREERGREERGREERREQEPCQ
jgi:hypothetical protein